MKSAKNPKACESIEEIRDALDQIDKEIIQLLTDRHQYVNEIVKFKSNGDGIVAKERQAIVFDQRRAWALERGLDPELIEGIFKLLIEKNIQIQFDIKNKEANH
jgi:isochorismate pyruvate lyase